MTENLLQTPTAQDWQEYIKDASQRSVLFMDVLRQRGDSALDHKPEPCSSPNPLIAWQDRLSQQTRDVIDTCCEVRDAATEYWLNSLYASMNTLTVQTPLNSRESDINATDQSVAVQPVTTAPPPLSDVETAPEQTVPKPVQTTKTAPAKRTVKSKALPVTRAPKPATTPRKPAKKSGKSTAAGAAKQAMSTPPLPLKMPKAGPTATLRTEAAPITQQKSDGDGTQPPTPKSETGPDSQA